MNLNFLAFNSTINLNNNNSISGELNRKRKNEDELNSSVVNDKIQRIKEKSLIQIQTDKKENTIQNNEVQSLIEQNAHLIENKILENFLNILEKIFKEKTTVFKKISCYTEFIKNVINNKILNDDNKNILILNYINKINGDKVLNHDFYINEFISLNNKVIECLKSNKNLNTKDLKNVLIFNINKKNKEISEKISNLNEYDNKSIIEKQFFILGIIRFIVNANSLDNEKKVNLLKKCLSKIRKDEILNHSAYIQELIDLKIEMLKILRSNNQIDTKSMQNSLIESIDKKNPFASEYRQPKYIAEIIHSKLNLGVELQDPNVLNYLEKFVQLIEFVLNYRQYIFDSQNMKAVPIAEREFNTAREKNLKLIKPLIQYFNLYQIERLKKAIETVNNFPPEFYSLILDVRKELDLKSLISHVGIENPIVIN